MSKERYNQIIDEVLKKWVDSKKCYRIRMNLYVEPKFDIISVDEVNIDDFPYVNSNGFGGFENNGIEELWVDFSNFKLDYKSLIKIVRNGFIYKIKTDTEFSERWGFKIEERELSLEERNDLLNKETNRNHKRENCFSDEEFERETLQDCKVFNIPTKQITLEYNGTKIEVYE